MAESAPSVQPGLCGSCKHRRFVDSSRGSRFVLCKRSQTDSRFPRYPRLPVIACAGFERNEAAPGPLDEASD